MHADLKWLAKNVKQWGGTYGFPYIFLEDGREDYCCTSGSIFQAFTRDQWQAARDELISPFSSPEEDEAWQAAEKRMDAIGHNGNDGDHYSSPEKPDIWATAPEWAQYCAPAQDIYYGRVDDSLVFQCGGDKRITSGLWEVDLEGPGFLKRPPAVTDDVTWQATDEEDEAFDAMAKREVFTGSSNRLWKIGSDGMYHAIRVNVDLNRPLEDDITAYDPPGPTSIPEYIYTTPDEEEAWREVEKKINPVWQSPHPVGGVCVFHGCRYAAHEQCYMCVLAGEAAKEEAKQPRYQDTAGEDWIDEAARTFTAEEFRGAMRFSIGKYNRRMGKKDELIKEIEKMKDYCQRWIDVEQGR